MNNKYVRFLSLLLVVIFALSCFGCSWQNSDKNHNQSDGDSKKSFEFNEKYTIVSYHLHKQSPEIADAIVLLKKAIKDVCGLDVTFSTDTSKKGEQATRYEYEILLGYTNTEESQAALSELGINDYTYKIISENVIVICGGTLSATYEAAKKFCLDVLGYDADTNSYEKKTVRANEGAYYTHKDSYSYAPSTSVTVGGVSINDYCVAVSSEKDLATAQNIIKAFGAYTGFSMPMIRYSDLDGSEAGVFCIGYYDREQKNSYDALTYGGEMQFSSIDGKITIGMDATASNYYNDIINKFFEMSEEKKTDTSVSLSIPTENITLYDVESTYGRIPQWTLVNQTEKFVRDGVTYKEMIYRDENNRPYRAYALFVDPAKVSFYMGTAQDAYTTTPDVEIRESVVGQMKSAVKNGVDVIAGTNGDFFAIATDYSPVGLAIKEGQLLSCHDKSRPHIAFMKDGSVMIAHDSRSYDKDNIQTAIGGRQVIVYNSLPNNLEKDTDFGSTYHPRTLAGIKKDGTVIMAVIDGRQPSHSNGASLASCAKFMISLGADSAINLDGGGSSTMVLRYSSDYNVMNSPSDGAPRKIFNSLLVVAKEKQ